METLQNIFSDCGLNVRHFERVHGGDINEAYRLITTAGKFFLKVNDAAEYPLMFEREARGLELLRKDSALIIPRVTKAGTSGDQQYLLLEWLDKGASNKNMWEQFGQGLALLHQQPQKYFGLEENNYIGSLQQANAKHNSWEMFYTECRLLPLFKQLIDTGRLAHQDIDSLTISCMKLARHFPEELPALLHGDLWAGNYLIHSSGNAAVYDPAVYFGHREMDIGMTKLFGGFDRRFYDAYNEAYPLEKDWEKRLPLTQLYPLLVHAVLFGGHYVSSALSIIKGF